jgi:hypothetical protein
MEGRGEAAMEKEKWGQPREIGRRSTGLFVVEIFVSRRRASPASSTARDAVELYTEEKAAVRGGNSSLRAARR